MELKEAIKRRRSVRKFASTPVERAKVEEMLRAAMQAPSAHNQQPWEFLVVENRELLEKLSRVHQYAAPLAGAPLGIVVLLNRKRLTAEVFWQQDLSAATQNMLLQAVDLGLGAVWMGIAPFEDKMASVREICQLPPDVEAFGLFAVGYSDRNRFVDRFDASRIHWETYQ
ncbi:MAG: nitroreductase family protein [Bacillota bacterium]|nr:nitroreductase family protein [Bacillota bacterium]MDW7678763.1 nitroreductase family protein [Bacillota bacterium]